MAADASEGDAAGQGFAALFLAYALLVLFVESPTLVYTSLPSSGAANAASRPLHLDGAGERGAPARPSKHAHREALEAESGRLRPSGIVSRLDLQHLNSSHSGSLRKVAARGRGRRGPRLLRPGDPCGDPDGFVGRVGCPHSIVLSGDEFRERGRAVELPCGLTLGAYITVAATPPSGILRSRYSRRGMSRSWCRSS